MSTLSLVVIAAVLGIALGYAISFVLRPDWRPIAEKWKAAYLNVHVAYTQLCRAHVVIFMALPMDGSADEAVDRATKILKGEDEQA